MTGFPSERRRPAVTPLVVVPTVMAVLLAGCNSMTYGTGKSPGMQTLQDLTGVAALGEKHEPINYTPRPKVVAPPSIATLPPPGSSTEPDAANWPNDPDKLKLKVIADADARAATGASMPYKFSKGTSTTGQAQMASASNNGVMSKEDIAKARAAFAAAKGNVAFDANGNPVRQYLTDPPTDYRVPDPTAPVVAEADLLKKKKKKFKWWWQQ